MICDQHSGLEVRATTGERDTKDIKDDIKEIKKDIKELSAKMNRFAGIIGAIASIPIILKLIEIFTPVAKAIVE